MNTHADPIVVEQTFSVPVAAVWRAITDQDQMRQWFFETITEFAPVSGFETEFDVDSGEGVYRHLWKVTDVILNKKIAYSWRYGGYPGDSAVVWELSETPAGTKLVLTHTGIETFPQDDPVFSRESGQAGWEYFLRDSLKTFLES